MNRYSQSLWIIKYRNLNISAYAPARNSVSSCARVNICLNQNQNSKFEFSSLIIMECSICINAYSGRYTKVVHTHNRVKHIFHKRCLQEWRYINDTCPICRDEIDFINSNVNEYPRILYVLCMIVL